MKLLILILSFALSLQCQLEKEGYSVSIAEKSSSIELNACKLPVMRDVKVYHWQFHSSSVTLERPLEVVDSEKPITHLVNTTDLKPGTYSFKLTRCDLRTLRHDFYNITVVETGAFRERLRLRPETYFLREWTQGSLSQIYLILCRLIYYMGELARGIIIFFQYYSDYTVEPELFFSTAYRDQWKLYGMNCTHYEALKTNEDLEAFRTLHPSVDISLVHLESYFAWNHNEFVGPVFMTIHSATLTFGLILDITLSILQVITLGTMPR